MSHLMIDENDGRLALYINGDLQFDRADERLYHEPLAAVPAALAARRFPGKALRALVLGGGDGLALRELLRFPQVSQVCLVERDPEMLRLGAGRFAAINAEAFSDPRVAVHEMDARDFLSKARDFDVLIYDFTYPSGLEGADLFNLSRFAEVRRALTPRGILAVNAVSPEKTPQAFACLAATLESAQLSAVPYAYELPSFMKEGYGRWGLFLASTQAISEAELASIELPKDSLLTPSAFIAGTKVPQALARMNMSPNVTDEILYHLSNSSPVPWEDFSAPLPRFSSGESAGPRLTASQGFAEWLDSSKGHRTLDGLLHCLPLTQPDQTRELILNWSDHAENIFRQVDLRALTDAVLSRAVELPQQWRRELERLRDRLQDGMPTLRELLEETYHAFAVLLIVMLLANLFFPENLYAKGNPQWPQPQAAETARPRASADVQVRLSNEMTLLKSGDIAYAPRNAKSYDAVVRPDRVEVRNADGEKVYDLAPSSELHEQVTASLRSQNAVVQKTIADHDRWSEMAKQLNAGSDSALPSVSDREKLVASQTALQNSLKQWEAAPAAPHPAGSTALLPGIYLPPQAQKDAADVAAGGE